MITGNREPTGVELHLNIQDLDLILNSLDVSANQIEFVLEKYLKLLPYSVVSKMKEENKKYLDTKYRLVDIVNNRG